VHDTYACLQDAGLNKLGDIFPRLEDIRDYALRPGVIPVPLTCAYGTGVDTDTAYSYAVDKLNAATAPAPDAVTDKKGDGTVNLRSLEACRDAGPKDATDVIEIDGGTHLGVVAAKQVLKALRAVLEMDSEECAAAMQAATDASLAETNERRPRLMHRLRSWLADDWLSRRSDTLRVLNEPEK
jgi:hypothetical protein